MQVSLVATNVVNQNKSSRLLINNVGVPRLIQQKVFVIILTQYLILITVFTKSNRQ
jgi:hypothetical protein